MTDRRLERPAPATSRTDPVGTAADQSRGAAALLEHLANGEPGECLSLGTLVDRLGDRAFGAVLLILALPNLIPMTGVSTLLGLPIALIGAQIAAGHQSLWLPRRLAAVAIERGLFKRMALFWARHLRRLEHLVRPCWPALTGGAGARAVGLALVILGIVLALPIPLGNQPPGLAVTLVALGVIERDGRAVAAGLGVGLVALAIVGAVVGGGIGAAWLLLHQLGW